MRDRLFSVCVQKVTVHSDGCGGHWRCSEGLPAFLLQDNSGVGDSAEDERTAERLAERIARRIVGEDTDTVTFHISVAAL